jgi:hypothetical protein
MQMGSTISEPILERFFDYSLGGYSHRERRARTRRYLFMTTGAKKVKDDSMKASLLPSEASFYLIMVIQPEYFQSNKTAICDSWVVLSQRHSNAMIYHEGKTPGSILCGLVYAHGCTLLVCIRVYDAKKILVDALGTLRITGIHSL